jgi:hypothetical protein
MLKFQAYFGDASASFVEDFSCGGGGDRRPPVTRPENKG